MFHEEPHLSDQDLAREIDGELSPLRSAAVRKHLESCWSCRARRGAMESAVADFVHLREQVPLPPIAGPRALLRARLEVAGNPPKPLFHFPRLAAIALLVALGIGFTFLQLFSSRVEIAAEPKRQLTPGATVPLTREDLCREDLQAPVLPASLKREVFESYGIVNARSDAFEVDYLITPELGGATNVRNLWPQPYNIRWNARVKDQLEERLRSMVCHGDIELARAQQEISTDWVSAYKKYFHTRSPLPVNSFGPFGPVFQILAMHHPEPGPSRFQIPPTVQ